MSVYQPAKSPFYAYDFRRGGERYSGSTGKTGRREAEAEERRLIQQAEAQSGPDGRKGLRRSQSDVPTLADAADRYWAEVSQHGASPDADLAALARLASLVGPGTPLTDITDAVVSEAVAIRRKQHRMDNPKLGLVSASTVNRSVTELLRRVLTRARKVWRIALPHEPNWGAHRLSEPKERVRELRYDEEEKLENVEREDYRAPRLFAQMTGLRRREVVGLTWSQVDFVNGTISVLGKGDKPHVIPITDELEALLRPLAGHHPTSVFTFVCGRTRVCARSKKPLAKGTRYPITAGGLATQMRRAIVKAGITGLRPMHDFRHTAATRTLRATGNLRLVQQLLNHASPATTAKYAHASLDDMREGMAKAASDSSRRRATLGGMGVQLVAEAVTPMQAAITEYRRILDAIEASPPFDCNCEELVALDHAEWDALKAVIAALCSNRADALAVLKHSRRTWRLRAMRSVGRCTTWAM